MSVSNNRVIVAGGGPVGLVAALALAKRGVPVTVLESEATPILDPRGAAFHPPTMEMLDALGVMATLTPLGMIVPCWQVRYPDGEIIAEFDLSLLKDDTAFPYRFHLGQHKVIPILLQHAATEPLIEVRTGHRVTAVCEDEDSVRVDVETLDGDAITMAARWVIGADGARSTVRKSANIGFDGFTWPERFVVTNLDADLNAFGFTLTNYVSDPDRWAVVLRLENEGGRPNWRVTYPIDPDATDEAALDPGSIQGRLAEIVAASSGLIVRYAGIYRVHQRVADKFRKGRILLIGDAAHINNPLGGFGLNSGIHDAINLAGKLAEGWNDQRNTEPLDLFDRQRRSINVKYVQAASIRNKQMLAERDESVRRKVNMELRNISRNNDLALDYLLNSSMIKSIREADSIV